MKVNQMQRNLNPGKMTMFSGRDLFKLIVPLIIEQFLAVMVGMVDTMMVSHVNEFATSAVSTVDTINILLINLFSALGAGGSVVAAMYLGHKDEEKACKAAKQLIYSSIALSGIIAVLAIALNTVIIEGCYGSLNAETKEMCKVYFFYSALSYPFLGIYNGGVGVLRAQGDSKSSMVTSLIMNVINIGGNALLIHPLQMGVAGAAIASLLSRAVSAVIIMVLLCKQERHIHLIDPLRPEWDWRMIRRILAIGLPNGLENSLFQLGKLLIMVIITTLPSYMIASNAALNAISSFPNIPGSAICLAVVTVIGQCVGAGDEKQARAYGFKMMVLMYLAVLPLNIIILIGAPFFHTLFNLSSEAMVCAVDIQYVYCFYSLTIWALSFGLPAILRSAGDAKYTMIVSIISMLVLRVGLSFVLVYVFDLQLLGVWLAMFADWLARGVFFMWRFMGDKWLHKKVI